MEGEVDEGCGKEVLDGFSAAAHRRGTPRRKRRRRSRRAVGEAKCGRGVDETKKRESEAIAGLGLLRREQECGMGG